MPTIRGARAAEFFVILIMIGGVIYATQNLSGWALAATIAASVLATTVVLKLIDSIGGNEVDTN
ncbi:hypothetical protein TPB0596_12250 [Tsukamurella pulmonis]|nr:hypothetical protein TPB0596_12250 [Tsukamurella pulmonis]